MNHPVWGVDAFATGPFTGNPAAVCVLEREADSGWMQQVAAEFNLSETAFLMPRGPGGCEGWGLRWFTPRVEVDLCGHATLAAAHVLWESGRLAGGDAARFLTRSGWLHCLRRPDGVAMDFPARTAQPAEAPAGLLSGLGCEAVWVGRDPDDYLVEVADAATVRGLSPRNEELCRVSTRGIVVTARSDEPGYDFISRFFAPRVGIDEDPVTGSAHGTLAGYWATRLGRRSLRGWQASRRGGAVGVEFREARVTLTGSAVTVWHGQLRARG